MTPEEIQALLTELKQIDGRAHALALQSLETPFHRVDLVDEADRLEQRLDEVVARVKAEAPDSYRQESHRISEATVDLHYTQGKTRFTSLRLGRELQRRRSG